jgi:hypothetical protein
MICFTRAPLGEPEWVTQHGLLDAQGPLRIGANPRLGAESRVCTPIRDEGRLSGFLSVLDPDETLTEDDLRSAGKRRTRFVICCTSSGGRLHRAAVPLHAAAPARAASH